MDRYSETTREIYNVDELNEMGPEGVRTAIFDAILRDYQPQAVDTALDWLKATFPQRRRVALVTKSGHQAQMDQVTQLATTLYPRLLRLVGERFALVFGQGYDETDVDALVNRIAGYFDSDTTLISSEVRGTVFCRARGNKTYDEPNVNRYLARVVEVLPPIE